ncbi:MAG: winged helix-turn-helix transcriptional regulator [Candidatus Helarchaeota archaeon]
MLKIKTKITHPDYSELEEEIFNIIKKLLKKNVTFQFNSNLINYCLQKVNTSEIEITRAIWSLLYRKLIVPGSTLTKEQILENQNRALIYETIKNHPGIHIRELCSILNKSSGVVRAHLEVLENFGYIRKRKYTAPRLILLFQKDFPETYDDYFVLMKNENDQRIIQLLINHQLTAAELSNKLNLHHSTIQYHLKKLEKLNFIVQIRENNTIKYTFNRARMKTFTEFLDFITVTV